ncbi:MAG: hypothetical protein ACYTGH_16195, partial [Planctomycetota bacterium]
PPRSAWRLWWKTNIRYTVIARSVATRRSRSKPSFTFVANGGLESEIATLQALKAFAAQNAGLAMTLSVWRWKKL